MSYTTVTVKSYIGFSHEPIECHVHTDEHGIDIIRATDMDGRDVLEHMSYMDVDALYQAVEGVL